MTDVIRFNNLLLWIISGIVILVLALLVTVIVRFNARANPVPSRTTHNTLVELIWTVIPVIILVVIALPSFRLMFFQLNVAARRFDREGDGEAVVLDLLLSGQRQF